MSDFDQFLSEIGLTRADMDAAKDAAQVFAPLTSSERASIDVARSPIEGMGVFSKTGFSMSDRIGLLKVGEFWTELGRYANHDPRPNAELLEDMSVIATRPILAGEEITLNYRQIHQIIMHDKPFTGGDAASPLEY